MNPSIVIDHLLSKGEDTLFHNGENGLILEALKREMIVLDTRPETILNFGVLTGGPSISGHGFGQGYSPGGDSEESSETSNLTGRGVSSGGGFPHLGFGYGDEQGFFQLGRRVHVLLLDLNKTWRKK